RLYDAGMIEPDDATSPVRRCGSCCHWRREPTLEGGFGAGQRTWGQCRRMPPTLPEIGDDKLVHVGVWPHTEQGDWCGEWQPLADG
ncbi:MAG: hypothetical protein EBZ59_12875, partial [Planctomycetia bacterium]|nr:hypothetical protein [Planctomycetia bacterium]